MRPGLFKTFVADEGGTASIEFSIVLGVLVSAFLAAGLVVGPAVKDYALHLKAVTTEARAVLDLLEAPGAPPAP